MRLTYNRIDEAQKNEHSVEMLRSLKNEHEERIEILTNIKSNKRSQIVLYKANIGENSPSLNYDIARDALISSGFFPSSHRAINLGLTDSPLRDKDAIFWEMELKTLIDKFNESIRPLLRENILPHISLFGFGPMPLLVKLGSLINDIQTVKIYQCHRIPKTWEWMADNNSLNMFVIRPEEIHEKVALNISLSGTISNNRITEVLGQDCSIYTLTIQEPYNDVLRSYNQMSEFQPIVQKLLDEIKTKHGQKNRLHVFPAMPTALAIELGRIRMPKADLPFIVYDQAERDKPFVETLIVE